MTQGDIHFSDLVRATFGPALFTGDWPRDPSFRAAIHIVEDMDRAHERDEEPRRHDLALELVGLARIHAPDLADRVDPARPLAA
jgi:hypothetical protein